MVAAGIPYRINALNVLKLAVEHGCDLSKLSWISDEDTILHLLVRVSVHSVSHVFRNWDQDGTRAENDMEICTWLLSLHPDPVNAESFDGQSPFGLVFNPSYKQSSSGKSHGSAWC